MWANFVAAHPPREAARLFAKVLGQIEGRGLEVVVARLDTALATGAPVLLAVTTDPPETSGRVASEVVPAALRDVEVTTGCAAD